MNTGRQRSYPVIPSRLSGAMAENPITIDGMKVAFDEKVALFPVTGDVEAVERPPGRNDPEDDRRGA